MTTVVDKKVGARIRQRRDELGVSLQRLGELTGYSAQLLRSFEDGEVRIGARKLQVVARALGASVVYFFDWAQRQPGLGMVTRCGEQRKHPRFPCRLAIEVRLSEMTETCELLDISQKGARITYIGGLPPLARINVVHECAEHPAVVMWSSRQFGHGLQFAWKSPQPLLDCALANPVDAALVNSGAA